MTAATPSAPSVPRPSGTAPAPRVRPLRRSALYWEVVDGVAMTWRNLVQTARIPELLIFATIQPVMFVLLFVFVFGGAINVPGGGNYVNFLMPGIFVQTVVFGATATGVGLSEDLQRGMVDRFRSLPMARSALLVGRTTADMLRNCFVVVLMTVVGVLVGFDPFRSGVLPFLVALVLVVLFGYAFSWISALIGLVVKDTEAVQSAGFIWVFPLTFLSSAFVPVATMPSWLQPIAEANPITVMVNSLRELIAGVWSPGTLVAPLAWTAVIFFVFAPLSVRAYRRIT